jgi:hypothetical protein
LKILAAMILLPGAAGTKVWDFKEGDLGKTPPGFTTALTGGGGTVAWVLKEEPGAPSGKRVLAQTSADETGNRFPLCVRDDVSAKDVAVSVKFKPVSGKVDQSGGIVLRYRDARNYYVARANGLEDNVRLYRVVDGVRKQFAGADTKVLSGHWHALKIEVKGKHFKVTFNDALLFEADDETFADAGKIGVWTKADSVTYFDDLKAESDEFK